MKFWVPIILFITLAGCAGELDTLTESEVKVIEAVFSLAKSTPGMVEKWSRSCALCHVKGEGGAPKMGDPEAWQSRLSQGNAVLYTHTIEGYNRMPPLGYCMDCTAEDFAAMINMLVGREQ